MCNSMTINEKIVCWSMISDRYEGENSYCRIKYIPDGIIYACDLRIRCLSRRKNNRRIDATIEQAAVIFEDNPGVNVTIDPSRKRPSPYSSETACHFLTVVEYTLRRTTRHIASGFYWRPPEFFSGFSSGFIMQNVGFSAHSYRGLPRRGFRQPLPSQPHNVHMTGTRGKRRRCLCTSRRYLSG